MPFKQVKRSCLPVPSILLPMFAKNCLELLNEDNGTLRIKGEDGMGRGVLGVWVGRSS